MPRRSRRPFVFALGLVATIVAAWLALSDRSSNEARPTDATEAPKEPAAPTLRLASAAACRLRGTVAPDPAVRVYVHSERAEIDLDAELALGGKSFSADLPEAGALLVVAVAEDGRTAEVSVECGADGLANVALRFPSGSKDDARVEGRCIYLETGAPVAGAIVRLLPEVGDGRRLGAGKAGVSAVADDRGQFVVRAPAGSWRVSCAKDMDGSEPEALVLAAREVRKLELVVGARASVVGVVIDEKRAPVEGAEVFARLLGRPKSDAPGERTDAEGRFHLRGLVPGPVIVEAQSEGRFAEQQVVARAGLPYAEVTLALASAGPRITGEVTSPDGEPLGGVKIEVETTWADRRPARVDLRRRATTTEDGRFAVGGIVAGRYRVSARAEGFAPGSESVDVANAPVDVKIVLQRACAAEVLVLPGSPVEPVRVRATRPDEQSRHRWRRTIAEVSGRTGEPIAIKDVTGQVVLEAETIGAVGRSATVAVDLCAARGPITVDLSPRAGTGALVAEVVDKGGTPLSGVEIELQPSGRSAVTGADGRARIDGLEPGDYGVRADGGMPTGVSVRASQLATTRIVLERTRGDIGGVVLGGGRPIEGASIRAVCGDSGQPRSLADAPVVARSDASGSFGFTPKDGGVCLVRAEHPTDGSSEPATLRVGGIPATLELRALGFIEGRVTELSSGRPVTAYTLSVRPVSRASELDARTLFVTDSGGRFRVDGLAAGTLSVSVTAGEGRAHAEVELVAGQPVRGLELHVFDKGAIAGRLVGANGAPIAGASISARRVSSSSSRWGEQAFEQLAETRSAPDGRFQVDVESGDPVRVAVRAQGYYPWSSTPLALDPLGRPLDLGDVALAARAGKEEKEGGIGIQFAGDPRGVRVVQFAPDSPSREAGLQIGDVITAIDGTPAGRQDMMTWLVALRGPPGTPVVLEIERGTTPRFSVTVIRRAIGLPALPEN